MDSTTRLLALGDSFTFGEAVPPGERWPSHLRRLLERRGLAVAEPMVLAVTGWTTGELADAISMARLDPPYDLVTLLIGVNDQYRGYGVDAYERGFAGLLETALALAGDRPDRLIVISIPDYSVMPFAQDYDPPAIRAALEQFNAVNRRQAHAAGARYVDVTAAARAAATDAALIARDGLHPSGKMYAAWAQLLLPDALAALGIQS